MNMAKEKVLAETLRRACTRRNGTSILTDDKLVLIENGNRREYRVYYEYGAHWVYFEG